MFCSLWSQRRSCVSLTIRLLLCLTILSPVSIAWAYDCENEVAQANNLYVQGKFNQAIELMEGCLNRPDLDPEVKGRAYRIIGLSYIALDLEQNAKGAIEAILLQSPGYMADLDNDPPPYVRLVEQVRAEQGMELAAAEVVPAKEEKGGISKAILGAGAAVVGVVAFLRFGGGGDEDNPPPDESDLPGPPTLPGDPGK
ncbi:MAG: hypothetical protein ABIF77_20170 [bacterium]